MWLATLRGLWRLNTTPFTTQRGSPLIPSRFAGYLKNPTYRMSLRLTRLCLTACLAAVLTAQAQVQPAATPPAAGNPADPLVGPIKLPDSDIDTVLGALEIYTGKNILHPQALPTATYNLKIDKQIPKSEAILAIETILELNGIGIVPMNDNFMKAVALQTARTEAPQMITGSALDLPPSSKVATKIFMLNFLRVNELVQQIQGMLTPAIGGALSVVQLPNANAALITDTVTNLQRIETLLKQVDQPVTSNLEPKFYLLKNGAKASDLVARINTIVAPLRAQLGTATTFTADDRTNQIILIAHPAQHALFDSLIDKLDIKADPNTNNAVIPLKHSVATDVATLLTNVVTGQNAAIQRASANSARAGTGAAGVNGANGILGGNPGNPANLAGFNPANPSNLAGFNGGGAVAGGPQGAAAGPGAGVPIAPTITFNNATGQLEAVPGSSQFSTLVTVLPDVRTNSIVVSGTATDIAMVRSIIDKLDILLAQVSIQVVIAEVTLTDTDVSGISALNLTVGTDTPAGAGGDNGRGTHITNFTSTLGGWNVTSGVVNPLSFVAALSNNGSNNRVKVLQANTIITEHGKQGDFQVQQKQPTITGTTSTPNSASTNGVTTQDQVTYQNIGVEVKVTPLIGADGGIELNIDQTVDDIIGNVTFADGNPYPIIGHREANVFINVQDGQMIVLGGLQSSKISTDRTKVGFLYEIPIISNMLGGRNNETDRRELLLFVRPHIISPAIGTADTEKKIESISEKKDIENFLKDESKMPAPTVIDRFVK